MLYDMKLIKEPRSLVQIHAWKSCKQSQLNIKPYEGIAPPPFFNLLYAIKAVVRNCHYSERSNVTL